MTMDINQLMALLKAQGDKQSALDRVAESQVLNQPIMQPGQSRSDVLLGNNSTPEQKRGMNAFYGSILNRDKTQQSGAGAMSDGFEKGAALMDDIRGRVKSEKLLGATTGLKGAQDQFAGAVDIYGAGQEDIDLALKAEKNALSAGKPQVISANGQVYLRYPDGTTEVMGASEGAMGRGYDESVRQDDMRIKRAEDEEATRVAAEAGVSSISEIMQDISDLNKGISGVTEGVTGNLLKGAPWASDAKRQNNKYTALKSKLAIGKLQEMRAAAANGSSGFGQLTEKELELLFSSIDMLDISTSAEQQRDALNNIRMYYAKALANYDVVLAGDPTRNGQLPTQGTAKPGTTDLSGYSPEAQEVLRGIGY